jgi:hypothetical protein
MQPQIIPFPAGRALRTARAGLAVAGLLLAVALSGGPVQAQTPPKPAVEAGGVRTGPICPVSR